MTPRLSAAGIAHAAVLAELHSQCFDESWPATAIADVLSAAGGFAFVALMQDETPAGFALARIVGDDAELLTLCVLSACRRRGLGALLLDGVMSRAGQIGARHLFLEVAETNDAARALYATRGFVAGRRRPDYYRAANRVPIAALELRCDLRSALQQTALQTGAAARRRGHS